MKEKVPIWLTDWVVQDKKKNKIKIKDVFIKFHDGEDVINNDMLVNIAMSKVKKWRKNHTFKPVQIDVKSQHDFGPPYEKK